MTRLSTRATVALRYELTPIHPVTRIDFAAPHGGGIDVGELRKAVADRYGLSPALGRAADIAVSLQEVLREKGYLHARVTPRADTSHAPHQASLMFAIEPGPRTLIESVDVAGTPSVGVPAFLKQIGVGRGVPYEREALNVNIDQYVEERRRRGYYEAKVVPSVTFSDGDAVATSDADGRSRPARARRVSPAIRSRPDRRDDLVPIEREGSADEDLLEDSTNRIEEYLRGRDTETP